MGTVSLELPTAIVRKESTPIDSSADIFEGAGVTVIVDQGPFADRLNSHVGQPEYREQIKEVAGTRGRTVFFRTPESGTYTVGVHVPAPRYVTVVVNAGGSIPERVPQQIIESLQFFN